MEFSNNFPLIGAPNSDEITIPTITFNSNSDNSIMISNQHIFLSHWPDRNEKNLICMYCYHDITQLVLYAEKQLIDHDCEPLTPIFDTLDSKIIAFRFDQLIIYFGNNAIPVNFSQYNGRFHTIDNKLQYLSHCDLIYKFSVTVTNIGINYNLNIHVNIHPFFNSIPFNQINFSQLQDYHKDNKFIKQKVVLVKSGVDPDTDEFRVSTHDKSEYFIYSKIHITIPFGRKVHIVSKSNKILLLL